MSEEQNSNPEENAKNESQEQDKEHIDVTTGDGEAADVDTTHLQEELDAAKDQALRAQAEMQNVRRRAEQDVEKARKFALERFVNDLLPVADNLERALAAIDAEDEAQKPIIEGVELTLKSLIDTLGKYQVEQINPLGEPFDPQLHEAMAMVPNPDMEPNSVMDVMEKGYSLNGRLIRPARVVVVKGEN